MLLAVTQGGLKFLKLHMTFQTVTKHRRRRALSKARVEYGPTVATPKPMKRLTDTANGDDR